jgi:hypothetical protein
MKKKYDGFHRKQIIFCMANKKKLEQNKEFSCLFAMQQQQQK